MHARLQQPHMWTHTQSSFVEKSRNPADHIPPLFFLTFLVRLMVPRLGSLGLSVAPDSSSCCDEQQTVS